MAQIPGTEVVLRGQKYTLPPLTLDEFEQVYPIYQKLDEHGKGGLTLDFIRDAVQIVLPSIRANHPEVASEQDLKKLLDTTTVLPALRAVLQATLGGMPEAKPGESIAP